MLTKIKILIAEHDLHDLEIIETELRRGGIDFVSEVVQNESCFRKSLKNFNPDVILSDYRFPSFDGRTAFTIREQLAPHIPFILVSGTIGEENSIELIKKGVTDFVLKDKMFNLNTKLVRALKESKERKEKNKLEHDLKQNLAHLAEAQKLAKLGSWDFDFAKDKLVWSEQLYKVFDTDKQTFDETHGSFLYLIDEADRSKAEQVSKHTRETGDTFIIEYGITTPKGEKRVIREHGYGVKNAAGKVIRLFGTAQDITESKKAAAALQQAYDEKNLVLESIDDGFFATDKNLLVNYWNSKAEILLGVKKEDILGKNLHETFADSRSPVFYDNYQKAIRENSTIRFEGFSNRTKKWFAVSAFANDNGLSVYFKDVTEQKNDEEKLKESELRYRSLIEQATDTICIVNSSWKFIEINPSGCLMFGYSKEEVLQLSIADLLFEEDLTTNPIQIDELKAGKTTHNERRIKRKDGSAVEVELNAKMIEDGRILVFGRDISKRKESERLIKESEAKFRSFFESSMDGILLTVTDGTILSANPAACEIFKMTEDEIRAAKRVGVVDLTDPRLNLLLEERQRTGRAKGELTLLRKDGSKFEAELSSAIFTDSFGRERTSMIIRDISERKAAEFNLNQTTKELQHTLNDLTKIMDSSMDIICTVDNTGKFVRMSAASQAIWGYSPQELINNNYTSFLYADDIDKSTTKDIEIKNGVPVTMFENRFVHKNGNIVPMLWSASWDEHDQLMYCIGKDATEKKKLEKANEIERERFMALYLQAPSCMGILKGPNYVFELANPLYLQLVNKSDIIGKAASEVFPELRNQGLLELLDTVYKTGNTFSANEMLLKLDLNGNGVLIDKYLNFIYQAHRNHDGDIDGIVFFVNDVTEQVLSRNKIEESNKEFQFVTDFMPQLIWVTKPDGYHYYYNKQWYDYTGLSPHETEGEGWNHVFHPDDQDRAWGMWRHSLATGEPYEIEYRCRRYDGEYRWFLGRALPLKDSTGSILKWFGTCTDIDDQKRATESLRKSEEKYRQIVDTAQEGIWLIDENNCTTFVNDKMCEIFGYTHGEMMGKDIYFFMDDEAKELAAKLIEQKKEGQSGQAHFKYLSKSGNEVWTNVSANPLFDNNGNYKGSLAMVTDITEMKRTELEMTWLINNTVESFILLDRNLNIVSYNDQFQQLHSKYLASAVEKGTCILDYALPERRQLVKEMYERVLHGAEEEYEMNIPLPDKSVKIFSIKYKPAKDEHEKIIGVFVSAIDVTEKKKSEQQLIIQERRYRALVDNGADGVVILTPEGKLLYTSPTTEKILGYSEEELMKLDMFSLFHPDDLAEASKVWEQVMNNPGMPLHDNTIRIMHKNGSWRWLEATLTNMLHDPSLNGIVDNFRDVTEKIEGEQLREFERIDKEALINTTSDFMWSVSSEFRLIAANVPFIDYMKNFDPRPLMPGDELFSKETFSVAYQAIWKKLYKRVLRGESLVKEMHSPGKKKHHEQWFETTLHPIYNNNKITGIACYSKDITERKQSEIHLLKLNEDLQKQAKELVLSNTELEQFAYVASHDLQEPLRMITSFLSRLEKKYGTVLDEKGKRYIHFAVDGAKRMRQIILDLLEFSRVGRIEDKQEVIELNELVDEIKILFRKQIQETSTVIISGNLPQVPGYRSPLRQVFQNLISNALKFGNQDHPSQININCLEFNDHWQFAVRDNGIGIEQEYFDKIFIIFQRLHNNDDYSGTGMGLAITKKIIENQGGKIWVESTEGKGSTFYFTLLKN